MSKKEQKEKAFEKVLMKTKSITSWLKMPPTVEVQEDVDVSLELDDNEKLMELFVVPTVQDQARREMEVTKEDTVGNNIIMKGVGDIIDEGAYSNMGTWLMRPERVCNEGEFGTLGKPVMVEVCGENVTLDSQTTMQPNCHVNCACHVQFEICQ